MLFEQFDPLRGGRLQILDPAGRVLRSDLLPVLTDADLRRMYALMVLTRVADRKALKLQRQGRLGTFASSLGHEACQVGAGFRPPSGRLDLSLFPRPGPLPHPRLPPGLLLPLLDGQRGRAASRPPGLNLYPLPSRSRPRSPRRPAPALAARLLKKAARRPGHLRRRRDLGGRFPRRAELRRRLPHAQRLRLLQQPVGHLDPAQPPDRLGHHRPEGRGLRLPRHPGRRERRPGRGRGRRRRPGPGPERKGARRSSKP